MYAIFDFGQLVRFARLAIYRSKVSHGRGNDQAAPGNGREPCGRARAPNRPPKGDRGRTSTAVPDSLTLRTAREPPQEMERAQTLHVAEVCRLRTIRVERRPRIGTARHEDLGAAATET